MVYGLKNRFGLLVGLSGLATMIGFATQLLVAFHFGTNNVLDDYWLMLSIATGLCFVVHPLRESLISYVFRTRSSDPALASGLITAGAILLFCCSVVGALVLAGISQYSGSFLSMRGGELNSLVLIFIPFLFLYSLAEMCNALLVSYDQALSQAWARCLSAVAAVACLGLLGGILGILAMVISLLVGQVIVLFFSVVALRSKGVEWKYLGIGVLKERAFLSMFVALIVSHLLAHFYVIIERLTMHSLEAGALSAYQYATLLVNVVITLFAVPLSNVLWPRLMELEKNGDRQEMLGLLGNTMAPVIFFIMAISAFTWYSAPDVVSAVFERGEFTGESHQKTTEALRLTIFAAVPLSTMMVIMRGLMSQGQSGKVATIGSVIAVVGVGVLALGWLMESLPVAQSHWAVSSMVGAGLACFMMVRSSGGGCRVLWPVLRSLAMGLIVVLLPLALIPDINIDRRVWWKIVVMLSIKGALYGGMVLLAAIVLKLVSLKKLVGWIRFG